MDLIDADKKCLLERTSRDEANLGMNRLLPTLRILELNGNVRCRGQYAVGYIRLSVQAGRMYYPFKYSYPLECSSETLRCRREYAAINMRLSDQVPIEKPPTLLRIEGSMINPYLGIKQLCVVVDLP